jgi:hypothetical protein
VEYAEDGGFQATKRKITPLGGGFCKRSGLIMDIKIYSMARAKERNLTCTSYTCVSVFESTGEKKCHVSG